MYSNNSESVRDALCFFLDEEKGHEVAYIQFPQAFENLTKNDIYGNSLRIIMQVGLLTNNYPFSLFIELITVNWKCSFLCDMVMMISRLSFEDLTQMEGLAILVPGAFTEGNLFQVQNTRQLKY